jgi:Uma2 family endonuclease
VSFIAPPPPGLQRAPAPPPGSDATPYRWTVEQYQRMGEAGVFEPGTRVELINGMIVEQDVRGERHSIPPEERTAWVWEYRWTVAEYERLVDAGIFPPDTHAELLYGTVYEMSPQGSKHSATLSALSDRLHDAVGAGYHLRVQCPLAFEGGAEPEPDIAIVEGTYADYVERHPAVAALAVEIAVSSIKTDREFKLPLYAAVGIPEYWIVIVAERCVEVYREPHPASYTYATKTTLRPGDTLAPLAAPDAAILVADLFF